MSTRDHPDWWRPMGGQNSQDSILERRSLIWNDNGIVGPTVPDDFYTDKEYVGKFFTRGCRGMIERIQLYCRDPGEDQFILRYSPHPCLGPVREVTILPLVTWAWRGVAIEEMWNYDSLFIWVYSCGVGSDWAYDAEQPYDGHVSTDLGATWADLAIRPFIRAVYTGETPGDVPVSGIINNIPIPSTSSQLRESRKPINADDETVIVEQEGTGYCDYIEALVDAAVNSHLTYIRVYCDDVLSIEEQYNELNTYGHTTATPTVSLPSFLENGLCYMLSHKRFEFRRRFEVRAYNLPNAQTVTISAHPTLLR